MARVVCFMRTKIVNKPESNFTVNSKIEINSGCILCVSLAPLLCNWIACTPHSSPSPPPPPSFMWIVSKAGLCEHRNIILMQMPLFFCPTLQRWITCKDVERDATYTLCPTPASYSHMMLPAVVFFPLYHALHLAFMLTILLQRDANRALDYPSHTHQHNLFYISNVLYFVYVLKMNA
jgi:hypothetical protein